MDAAAASPSVSVTLNDLPNELLCKILREIRIPKRGFGRSEIPEYFRPRDFKGIAAISRRFNAIVTPFLYMVYCQPTEASLKLKLFIRTLIKKPQLAMHVKSLRSEDDMELELAGPSKERAITGNAVFTTRDMALLLSKIRQLAPSQLVDSWLEAISGGNADVLDNALLALILCLCPNMEDVYISNWKQGSRGAEHLLDWSRLRPRVHLYGPLKRSQSQYKALQRLDINVNSVSHLYILKLFQMPSLCSLTLRCLRATGDSVIFPQSRNLLRWSSVKHLHLLSSNVSDVPLAQMLVACRTLVSFEYSHSRRQPLTLEVEASECSPVSEALEARKLTIEYLNIGVPHLWSEVTMPILKQLHILHDLHLGADTINPTSTIHQLVDYLPQSIRALTISQGDVSHNEMDNFLKACWAIRSAGRVKFPELNSVKLCLSTGSLNCTGLEEAFGSIGVVFEVQSPLSFKVQFTLSERFDSSLVGLGRRSLAGSSSSDEFLETPELRDALAGLHLWSRLS